MTQGLSHSSGQGARAFSQPTNAFRQDCGCTFIAGFEIQTKISPSKWVSASFGNHLSEVEPSGGSCVTSDTQGTFITLKAV